MLQRLLEQILTCEGLLPSSHFQTEPVTLFQFYRYLERHHIGSLEKHLAKLAKEGNGTAGLFLAKEGAGSAWLFLAKEGSGTAWLLLAKLAKEGAGSAGLLLAKLAEEGNGSAWLFLAKEGSGSAWAAPPAAAQGAAQSRKQPSPRSDSVSIFIPLVTMSF